MTCDAELILDPRLKYHNGGTLNEFGSATSDVTGGSIVPYLNRHDEGWTFEILNGGTYHGMNYWDFSSGIPARPDTQDGNAHAVWAVHPTLNAPCMRLDYGVNLDILRQYTNFQLTFWYCIPRSTDSYAMGNLANSTFGSPYTQVLADINTGATFPGTNYFLMLIRDAQSQARIYSDGSLGPVRLPDDPITDNQWHQVTYNFTLDANAHDFCAHFGGERGIFELWFAAYKHTRMFFYDIHLEGVS